MQKQLLHNLLCGIKSSAFEVTYWDGTTERYGPGAPCFKL
ncbi:MAG TPA: cyclopropane-fatty-acyl-phospholipid synthase, partial [Pelotomaculum sp.]|nr:cyclopropane-fatty-acyl-phospholipid synthase [Pelotomaculum sp.]